MLVAIGGIVTFVAQSDADGTNDHVTNGKITVNLNYGISWEVPTTVDAYNGAIALDRSLGTSIPHVIDMNLYTTDSYGYVSVNYQYGAITSINNIAASGDNVWNVFVLNESGSWVKAVDSLGWYKPFGDYDLSHRTANIAVVYGTESGAQAKINSFSPSVTSSIVPVTDIVGNDNFKMSFYVKVSQNADVQAALEDEEMSVSGCGSITAAMINEGTNVTGYGSDLYLALKNAFPGKVTGQDAVPCQSNGSYNTVYSWISTFLDLSTIQVTGKSTPTDYSDDSWAWWIEYSAYSVGDSGNVTGTVSNFALGLYSTISDAPLSTDRYALYFGIGGM